MKGWAKILLGVMAALVLFCLFGVGLFVSSGKWDEVKKMTGETLDMKKHAEGLETLSKEFPFEPPPDGVVEEARLEAWLLVRESLKPHADKFNAWAEANQGKQGGWKEAQEAISLVSSMVGTSVKALREAKMSQREYHFVARALAEAERESVASSSGGPLVEEALRLLADVAQEPSLSEEKRAKLSEALSHLKSRQEDASGPLPPNAQLYRRYASRIRASDLGEYGNSFLQSGGQHRVQVGESP